MSRFLPGMAILGAFLTATSGRAEDDFRTLFNGKDLTGWVVDGAKEYTLDGKKVSNWTVEDGLLVTAGKGFGFLRYDKVVTDFRLHAEVRLSSKGNSGFGIRTVPYDATNDGKTRPSYVAYEVQFQDDAGKGPDPYCTGSLYRYIAPTKNPVKKPGEWNEIDIECVGPRIRVWINGDKVLDVDQSAVKGEDFYKRELGDALRRRMFNLGGLSAAVAKAEQTAKAVNEKPLKGYVCLQSHTNKVEFRNVKLREIASEK